jgi:hypothetical protein
MAIAEAQPLPFCNAVAEMMPLFVTFPNIAEAPNEAPVATAPADVDVPDAIAWAEIVPLLEKLPNIVVA